MAEEFKKIIGAVTEFFLTLSTWLYILWTFWDGGTFEDIHPVVWGVAVALIGKYGLSLVPKVLDAVKK